MEGLGRLGPSSSARVGGVPRGVPRGGGARAFWRGNGANVLKVVPETAVKFAAFDAFKRAIANDPGNATAGERFLAGGLAGALAQATIYPLEIVKTRLALGAGENTRGGNGDGNGGGRGACGERSGRSFARAARGACSAASRPRSSASSRTPGSI